MATVSASSAAGNAWLSYWNGRPWPVLRETRERLLPLLRRADRIKADEVAEVVLADPLLCAQVLKLVNQREKSSLAADVVTMESAIMLYGLSAFLERFCRGITVEDVLQSHPATLGALYAEIAQTLMLARLARDFANQRIDSRLEEIYLAACLARVPHMLALLASADPAAPATQGGSLTLIDGWKLPDALRKLNDFSGELPARVAMQAAIMQGLPALADGWWQPQPQHAIAKIAEVLNVPAEEIWAPVRDRLLNTARNAAAAPPWPAARWLPMLPGDWPPPPVAQAASVPVPKAAPAAVAPPSAAVPVAPVAAAPVPVPVAARPAASTAPAKQADAFQQAMQALQLAGQQGAQTNQVMQLAFKALINGLGMRRVMLSLLDSDKITLKARFTHSAASDDPLRTFALALDPPHLITKLMSKQQSIWLNAQTRAELAGRLPPLFLRQAGDGDFCAMSLFVGPRAVGLIYADRSAENPLDDHAYQHFKQICVLVSRALADRAH